MSVIKNSEQVEKLKCAASLLSQCLDLLVSVTTPGKTAKEIDLVAEEFILDHGAIPAFKNYSQGAGGKPFPANICFSKNTVVVHGIPKETEIISEGDIITIDCGLSLDGWFADAARLFGVGEITSEDAEMINSNKEALDAGIQACIVGNKVGDICSSIQKSIEKSNFYNVYQFCGHAIGEKMHEEPQIPNFGRPHTGLDLEPGMVFCLEPILRKNKGTQLGVLADGWTIVTLDKSRATHVEHMVLVTESSPQILTL